MHEVSNRHSTTTSSTHLTLSLHVEPWQTVEGLLHRGLLELTGPPLTLHGPPPPPLLSAKARRLAIQLRAPVPGTAVSANIWLHMGIRAVANTLDVHNATVLRGGALFGGRSNDTVLRAGTTIVCAVRPGVAVIAESVRRWHGMFLRLIHSLCSIATMEFSNQMRLWRYLAVVLHMFK